MGTGLFPEPLYLSNSGGCLALAIVYNHIFGNTIQTKWFQQ